MNQEDKKCPATNPCDCSEQNMDCPLLKKEETPMQKLFSEFEALSESSEFAGDKQTSGLINFLCERKHIALSEESKYIRAGYSKSNLLNDWMKENGLRNSDYQYY